MDSREKKTYFSDPLLCLKKEEKQKQELETVSCGKEVCLLTFLVNCFLSVLYT